MRKNTINPVFDEIITVCYINVRVTPHDYDLRMNIPQFDHNISLTYNI